MSIRFAAPSLPGDPRTCSPIAKALVARATDRAANDNGVPPPADHMIRAALKHFGKHGLGAAREARAMAEEAFFSGDRQSYDWWMEITRTLDRRMAAEAARAAPAMELS